MVVSTFHPYTKSHVQLEMLLLLVSIDLIHRQWCAYDIHPKNVDLLYLPYVALAAQRCDSNAPMPRTPAGEKLGFLQDLTREGGNWKFLNCIWGVGGRVSGYPEKRLHNFFTLCLQNFWAGGKKECGFPVGVTDAQSPHAMDFFAQQQQQQRKLLKQLKLMNLGQINIYRKPSI